MARKKKQEENSFQEEDSQELEDDYSYQEEDSQELEDDYSSSGSSGLEDKEKPALERIFDFSRSVLYFEMQLRGYDYNSIIGEWVKVTDEKGPDEFIKQTMVLLTSIISSTNFWTYKNEKESEKIKGDTIETFINLCADEEEVNESDIDSLVTSFDNVMDLFMGLVEKGHGSVTLKEIYAGVATTYENQKTEKKSDFLQNIANKLSFGGEN